MKRTRIAALLLALVLCLGLLPMTALATETNEGDLKNITVITDNQGSNNGSGGKADEGELKDVTVITDNVGWREFTITFDASPGKFPDGTTTRTVRTTSPGHPGSAVGAAGDSGLLHIVRIPAETPVLEGYTFAGWYVDSPNEYPSVANRSFTADTTVKANWTKNAGAGGGMTFKLDPNGGTVNPDTFTMDENYKVVGKLPTPTRTGYTFKGWYIDGKLVDESKPITSTAPFPVAQWERSSKITPAVSASPAKIEAGAEKVEVTLSCTTSGAMLDWRPFERLLFGGNGGNPADVEGAVKQYIYGDGPNSPSGLKLTGIDYKGSYDWDKHDDSAYPRDLYPEGVCPTPQLVLTYEGKAVAGKSLYIYVEPGCFVQPVTKNEHLVLTESSDQIFERTKLFIPITGTAASANGPFTVKFDLNYKDAPKAEVPKEKTVVKGSAVPLPDGSKLTPPASSLEFYMPWKMP